MNKLSSFALAASFLAAVSVMGPERAQAAPTVGPVPTLRPTASPGLPAFLFTTVKGTIKVSGAPMPGAPLGGWNCDDLWVGVSSKELASPPGELFTPPKWTRGAKATGNWASGTCSFSVNIVPNSAFYVGVSPSAKDYPCDYIGGMLINPGSSPLMIVPKGQSKNTPDFTASGQPLCKNIQ